MSNNRKPAATAAFSLVEVMIAAALGAVIFTAVMSTFLMIGRSGAVLSNYISMETQARRALEKFGEDTRMSNGLSSWTSISGTNTASSVVLKIPHVSLTDTNVNLVTYTFNSAGKTFTRTEVDTDSSGTTTSTTTSTLLTNVTNLVFNGWISGSNPNVPAAFSNQVDELQLALALRVQANEYGNSTSAVAAASNFVVSARYIMRNK